MERIRTYQFFRFLCNGAVLFRRQQFRADRCVQYIPEDSTQCRLGLGCLMRHQIAHQRFRDRGVYSIHTHVIAVIGCPAQRQFGQVACADDNAAGLVRQIHENLCPFPCLAVLVCHIVNGFVMPDVPEVLTDAVLDGDFPQGRTICLCQTAGVLIGAVCCAETGHSDCQHPGRVKLTNAESVYHNDKCQRRVQSAGESDHSGFAADVPQTGGESHCLERQDLFAALCPLCSIARHKRRSIHKAVEPGFCQFHGEGDSRTCRCNGLERI